MIKTKVFLFIISFLAWIVLSWSVDYEHLIVGVLIGILVSSVTSDIFADKVMVFKRLKRYFWFLCYIPVFAWECVKANLDGAYRVIHPDTPINPGIVKVKTTLKSNLGITILANSITLKPGTMVVDVDKEGGFLYVHWVDVKSQDTTLATKFIVQRLERILKRIFE